MPDTYDAIVIGAGPAGGTAAIVLARAGWRVAVVERQAFPRRKVCGEFISAPAWSILDEIGVAGALRAIAGPDVRRVACYAREAVLEARMPAAAPGGFGRAVRRQHLDSLLLERARAMGAEVLQPHRVVAVERRGRVHRCSVRGQGRAGEAVGTLQAPVVIGAYGSWEAGPLPTRAKHRPPAGSDLLAFKAYFRRARLPAGTMPLLLFPGGYGGMVQADDATVGLSCCIRRDMLVHCRQAHVDNGGGRHAGDAVLAHIAATCRGARDALASATRDGPWLAAGPMRPGIRSCTPSGLLAVGNLAGEAHPMVAEGICMSIQSAWLLATLLVANHATLHGRDIDRVLAAVGTAYRRSWRSNFATRIETAGWFAHLALHSLTQQVMERALLAMPSLLTTGAYCSGKASLLRMPACPARPTTGGWP